MRLSRIRLSLPFTFVFASALSQSVAADDFLFQTICDNVWQSCCDLDQNTKINNWNRTSPSPVCPVQPTGADNVTIQTDCIVAPTPGVAAGVLEQSGGTFTLNGGLGIGTSAEFDGPFIWNAAEIGRSGGAANQYARMNGGLNIAGDAEKFLSFFGGFRLINAGAGGWSGNGTWTIGMTPGGCCPAIFENAAGATFTVTNNTAILATAFGPGRIENAGTIVKDLSTGGSDWNVTVVNTGTLHVKTGEVALRADGSGSGTFRVDAGATLAFAGTDYQLLPGVTITGAGTAVVRNNGTGPGNILINDVVTVGRLLMAPGGRATGTGTLGISELLTVNSDGMNVRTYILPGGRLEVISTHGVWPLDVSGIAHIPTGATLQNNSAAIRTLAGGEIQIEDGGTLAPLGNGVQPIENFGTIRKMPGVGTGTIASAFGWYLNNQPGGRIVVDQGTLASSNNFNTSGNVHTAAGATFKHQNWGSYHPGATFTGDGWFHLDQASNNFIDDGFTLVVPRLRVSGNTDSGFNGTGRLTITRQLDFQGGGLRIPLVTIAAGAEFVVSGPNATLADATVENLGITRIVGQEFAYGAGRAFNNRPGAIVNLQSDYYFGARFGNGVLNNEGTVVKSAGAGDSFMAGTLNNTGLVRLQTGRIKPDTFVQNAGTTRLEGGGMFAFSTTLNGGTLTGSGALHTNLTNVGGVIAPGASAGTLSVSGESPHIAGDFTQGVNGSLRIEIGGLAVGSGHDQIAITRNASLDGGLNIDLVNGFAPQLGNQFVILTAGGTRTGQFAHVSGVQLGGGLRFNVQYNPNNVTLVVAEGGTIPGDLTGDGHVGLSDLTAFLSSFGLCDGQAGFNPTADFDGDGCVSISDLTILLSNFGM